MVVVLNSETKLMLIKQMVPLHVAQPELGMGIVCVCTGATLYLKEVSEHKLFSVMPLSLLSHHQSYHCL